VISPTELIAALINTDSSLAVGGAVVGPANDEQQQEGIISVVAAGLPVVEKYIPLQWMRAQIRCLAGTLDEAEAIGQRVYTFLNGNVRVTATQASTGETYLIHLININAGPSMHFDTAETWETLLFAEILISVTPVS
jgi:hypothetical protein